MANFESAITIVLKHEGGYVDDTDDPGGVTNYGVSLRWLRSVGEIDGTLIGDLDGDGDVDADDIRQMSKEDAEHLYRTLWWDKYQYDEIEDQVVANKVFDLAVNMSARQSHKILQRALRANNLEVQVDGIIGPKTMTSINLFDNTETYIGVDCLIAAMRSEAASFYRVLIAQKPKFEKYRAGWLTRAYS